MTLLTHCSGPLKGMETRLLFLEKILELSFNQYFLPAAARTRRRRHRAPQESRGGSYSSARQAVMAQGSTEAGAKWSQCLPTVDTALTALHQAELNRVLGVIEDLGVTCGGWRGKGRKGQEPRDSELDGAGWNARPYQGSWGLSLPIWEMGQRRSVKEWTGPSVHHESLGNLDQNLKETSFFPSGTAANTADIQIWPGWQSQSPGHSC